VGIKIGFGFTKFSPENISVFILGGMSFVYDNLDSHKGISFDGSKSFL
jgi:hypothetical protein